MLVLSRTKGEEVVIGKAGDVLTGPIVVALIDIVNHGTKARLGFECQTDITVHRKEVQERIDQDRFDRP